MSSSTCPALARATLRICPGQALGNTTFSYVASQL